MPTCPFLDPGLVRRPPTKASGLRRRPHFGHGRCRHRSSRAEVLPRREDLNAAPLFRGRSSNGEWWSRYDDALEIVMQLRLHLRLWRAKQR
jgi:hypothetical protein